MVGQNPPSPNVNLSAINRDGLAIISVALALILSLSFERYDSCGDEFPVFQFAIPLTVWYQGLCSGILAILLSSLPEDNWTRSCTQFLTPGVRRLASEYLSAAPILIWTEASSGLKIQRGAAQSFYSAYRPPALPSYEETGYANV
jgi:hypothetical protein